MFIKYLCCSIIFIGAFSFLAQAGATTTEVEVHFVKAAIDKILENTKFTLILGSIDLQEDRTRGALYEFNTLGRGKKNWYSVKLRLKNTETNEDYSGHTYLITSDLRQDKQPVKNNTTLVSTYDKASLSLVNCIAGKDCHQNIPIGIELLNLKPE